VLLSTDVRDAKGLNIIAYVIVEHSGCRPFPLPEATNGDENNFYLVYCYEIGFIGIVHLSDYQFLITVEVVLRDFEIELQRKA
jgi:hypothetical protein